MMYLAFYLTDSNHKVVFQHLMTSKSYTFPQLVNRIHAKAQHIDFTTHYFSLGKHYHLYRYFSLVNGIYYWCLAKTSQMQTLEPYVLLHDLDEMLLEYFDKDGLNRSNISENLDRISLAFHNYIDNGGIVVDGTQYVNQIKQRIPEKADLTEMLYNQTAKLANARQGINTANDEPDSVVTWRVRDTSAFKSIKNELYIDIHETLHLVTRQSKKNRFNLKIIHGTLAMQYIIRAFLPSTAPIVEIKVDSPYGSLANGTDFPMLHECVDDWKGLHSIKLIPPEGRCKFLEHGILMDPQTLFCPIVDCNVSNHLGAKQDEFEVNVSITKSNHVKKIKNLIVSIEFVRLEQGIHQGTANPESNKLPTDRWQIKVLRTTHGRLELESASKLEGAHHADNYKHGNWIIDKELATGNMVSIRGCYENYGLPETAYKITRVFLNYSYEGMLISGTRVKSINIDNHTTSYDPKNHSSVFKGVKYQTTVKSHEIRVS